ncbi:hypothetical protein NQ317_002733 [Molorchus minor]|uniref:Uncharacterized protein n=1 Tax=Molorchus minor TaxID=1323400 RepID=A0ABQ9K5L0_9CUCU|nr:hypothetical protein NQ317_002733 [Molorchus minor]
MLLRVVKSSAFCGTAVLSLFFSNFYSETWLTHSDISDVFLTNKQIYPYNLPLLVTLNMSFTSNDYCCMGDYVIQEAKLTVLT